MRFLLAILVAVPLAALGAADDVERLRRLVPLHAAKTPVQPGDWLEGHPERGQTYAEWLAARRNLPTRQRTMVVLQPLGAFDAAHQRLQDDVEVFLGAFFGLPVRRGAAVQLTPPAHAQRTNPHTERTQWRTDWLLDELRNRRPADAVAVLGLTTTDLWPGEGWNFVFGMAQYHQRVGVWSTARYGDIAQDPVRVALRTVKVALHETGHMFTIEHCTAYQCLMNGCNNLAEADRTPLDACPECTAKIWALVPQADPVARYRRLAALATERTFTAEAAHWTRCAEALAP